MANELTIPGGDNKVALPAHILARFKPEESNIIAGDRGATLSIKGKVFTISADGETTQLMRTDDEGNEFPLATLPVIVLDYGAKMGRSYYENDFDPNEIKEPVCYSLDSVAPEDDSEKKQSDKCATCPMAVKGSKVSDKGKPLTACSQHRILAVIPVKRMDLPPLRLRIAQTSNYDGRSPELKAKGLLAFQNYLDYVRARGIPHTQSVVTQLSFDPSQAYPKLLFKASRYTNEDELAKIDLILETGKVEAILGKHGADVVKKAGPAGPALPAPKSNVVALPAPKPENVATAVRAEPTDETDDEEAALMAQLAAAKARKAAAAAPKGPTPEEVALMAQLAAGKAKAAAEKAEADRLVAEEEARAKAERMAKLKAELEASVAAEAEPEDEEAALMRQLAEARAKKAGAATGKASASPDIGATQAPAAALDGEVLAPKRTRRTKEQIAADEAAKLAEIAAKNPERAAAIAEIPAGEKFIPGAISGNDMGEEDDGSFAEPVTVASEKTPADKPKSTAKVNEAVPAVALSADVENLLQTWND